MMRLAAMGTAALSLSVAVVLVTAALVLPFELGMPGMVRTVVRPLAADQMTAVDDSLKELEQAIAKKDWDAVQKSADRTYRAMENLETAIPALAARDAKLSSSQLRDRMASARERFREVQPAVARKDASRTELAMQRFREEYGRVQESVDLKP
jgi:hypothetical protein